MKVFKFDIQHFAEVINLTGGNDDFTITGSDKIIYAKGGHDSIYYKDKQSNVTIIGGDGADTIRPASYYTANNFSVAGGAGNDSIYNYYGVNWTISGDEGDDNIQSYGNNNSINGGSGNDSIESSGQNAILIGGDGGDKIRNSGSNAKITGGNGNDSINSSGDYVYIDSGNGEDYIESRNGTNVSIIGGAGKDEIKVDYNKNGYINGGDGDDLIKAWNGSDNVTVIGGKGNDKIDIGTAAVMVQYTNGDGNDSIFGFDGNDTLKIAAVSFDKVTIDNDVIVNVGNGKITLSGAKNKSLNIIRDTIIPAPSGETVSISNDSIAVTTGSGKDSIYSSTANYVTIYAGDGADTISGNYYNSKIYGGTGNDYIKVVDNDVYKYSYVILTSRNIRLPSVMGGNLTTTIDGGDGDDTLTIVNFTPSSINGGNGNDKISLACDYAFLPSRTVAGGKGNDVIYGVSNIKGNTDALRYNGFIGTYYQYSYGDGNDTIYNFHYNDTISIGGSSSYTTLTSGDNVIVSVIGSGSITLYNDSYNSTKNKKVSIVGGKYEAGLSITTGGGIGGQTLGGSAEYSISGGILTVFDNFKGNKIDLSDYSTASKVNATALSKNVSIVGTAAANSIKGGSGADTINGNAGADIIYGGSGNDKIYGGNDNDKLYGDAGNDSLYGNAGNDTLTGGAGNDIFFYESGNDLITDYTAGQDKIKFNVAVISDTVSGNNVIFKTAKGNVTVQNGKGKKITVIDSTGKETTQIYPAVIPPNPTPTLPGGWKYDNTAKTKVSASITSAANINLNQSYGTSVVTVDGSKITAARSFTGNAKANSIKAGKGNDTINGNAGADILYGGSGNDKIYGGNDNDKLYGDAGNDSLYGNAGNDTLTGGAGNDTFYYESGNDLITDYTAGQDKIKFSVAISSSSISGNNIIFKTSKGNVTVQNGKGKKITVIDSSGKTTTKIYPESNPLPNGWKYGTSASTNNTASIITATLVSAANVDLNQGYGKNVTKVDGSKITKAISITGKATADSLKGGNGSDTIKGNAGNDTVYGGNGNDKIYGDAGADKLYGDAGNDIIYGGIGNDTIYGGANNDKIYGDEDNDKLYGNAGNDSLYGGVGNDTLYGGNDNDKLYGDAGNDKLYGDAGNDSLYGGSGNDTFTGGDGADIFVYQGGNDVITDYTAGQDKIKLSSGKITKTTYSGKDVIFTIGSGNLTVKNGKGKKITVTDSSNKTQTYSKTLDLMYDNNFVSDDFSLDSITEKKYSVTQIKTIKTETFAQDETFLTYSEDK